MNISPNTLRPVPPSPTVPYRAASAHTTIDAVALTAALPSAPVSPCVGPARAPSAPQSGPDAPPATAGSVDVWPALEHAGLLGGANAVGGPIGVALTDATRRGLLDALRRIEGAGVVFEQQRGLYVPGLQSRYAAISADALAQALETQPSHFETRYSVTIGDQAHIDVESLADLRLLDAYRGAGPTALPQRAPAVEATRSLENLGFTFQSYGYSKASKTRDASASGGFASLLALTRPQGYTFIVGPRIPTPHRRIPKESTLLELDFFVGSGTDRGLPDSDLAATIREASARGFGFVGTRYETNGQLFPLDAWDTLRAGRALLYGPTDGAKMSVTARDLTDPSTLEPRLQQAQDILTRFAIPAMADTPLAGHAQTFVSTVLESPHPHPVESKALVLGALVRAALSNPQRDVDMERPIRDMNRLLELEPDPVRLHGLAALCVAAAHEGGRTDILASVIAARREIEMRAGSPAERAKLEAMLVGLAEKTEALSPALEALDLVRIPISDESDADRLQVFSDLATTATPADRPLITRRYRDILVHRLPNESLASAGARFLSVMALLDRFHQQARAFEVFAYLQQGTREGRFGTYTADEALHALSERLVLSRSIDDALASLPAQAAPRPSGDATVRDRDDHVIIGGVRVPKGPSR